MVDITKLTQKAIKASLENNHAEALEHNLLILKKDPKNLCALNRTGKCFLLLNKLSDAKVYYTKVLELDPYNPIAKKNLKLINHSGNRSQTQTVTSHDQCYEFLEIPGKTQTVKLTKLADRSKFCQINTGQVVMLVCRTRTIRAYVNGCYLGCLPDDLSLRLNKLITRGNQFKAYIKSVSDKQVHIFIKEIEQSKKNINLVSFPSSLQAPSYQTTISRDLVD